MTVTEEKRRESLDIGRTEEIYLYSIKAVLESDNPLVPDIEVTTIDKPFTITLPNNISETGRCYIGTRGNDNSPWHYTRVTDGNVSIANLVAFRASQEKAPKEVTFTLYRAGIQFALFVFDDSAETVAKAKVEVTESSVTEKITTKDGKYTQNLEINSILKGIGLENIKSSDLTLRVTFNCDTPNLTTFKADNRSLKLSYANNEAASGGKFAYSFDLKDTAFESQLDSEVRLKYVLNTDKVNTADFPTGFLVEFVSATDNEKLTPFYYSEFLTFETEEEIEPEPEPIIETFTITYNLDGGNLAVGKSNPTTYDEASDTITLFNPIKTGYTFVGWSGTEIDGIASDVTILQGSTGNREYTANWNENPPDTFTLILNKGAGIATVTGAGAYEAGIKITASCTMLEGYEFVSWSGDYATATITMPKKDVAMTANAKPIVYSIAYELNGGQPTSDNPVNYDVTSDTIPLNNPIKTGYTFTGWSGTDLTGNDNTSVSIVQGSTGDRTYTAHWSEVAYIITYNLDGGTENTNPTGYNTASDTFMLNPPTKTGYTFVGWSGTGIDGIASDVTIIQGSTGDRSYTANWSINSYKLDIVKGTGINTVTGDGLHEYNSSVTASCTMLAGYEFDNWSGNFTTATFNMPAYNATMTANARPISYTITYDLDGGTNDAANPTTYDITSATITLNAPTKQKATVDGDTVFYLFGGWTGTDITNATTTVTIPQGSTGNREYTANWVLLKMKSIPAGTFAMGCCGQLFL